MKGKMVEREERDEDIAIRRCRLLYQLSINGMKNIVEKVELNVDEREESEDE